MNPAERTDPIWDTAWEWLLSEHEQTLDPERQRQLAAWLQADPAHRAAYDDACRVWLAAALVPAPEAPEAPERASAEDPGNLDTPTTSDA